MHSKLTPRDVTLLAAIVTASQESRLVRWLDHDGEIIVGTARSVGANPEARHPEVSNDIRDNYLRITDRVGIEHYLAVTHVMRLLAADRFIAN